MEKLVFATNNEHKLHEVQALLRNQFELISLQQSGINEDIPEDRDTLEGNAMQKVEYIFEKLKMNVFADDTGLEIEALNGEPGVYSARYAGPGKEAKANMQKVLSQMKGITNRKARFRTVIALILHNKKYLFEGIVDGQILEQPAGSAGFGYDPIFQPDGFGVSFAEMPLSQKNTISHRAKAVNKLIDFLNNPSSQNIY